MRAPEPIRVRDDELGGRLVSASEIARLAYCEQQIRLDAIRGCRTTAHQRAARRRGEVAHQAFYEESRRLADRSATRGKCFIATMVLGETAQTLALRQFRDLVLRRSRWGRAATAAYYMYSPSICDALAGRPRLLKLARGLLQLAALVASVAVRRRSPRDEHHDS